MTSSGSSSARSAFTRGDLTLAGRRLRLGDLISSATPRSIGTRISDVQKESHDCSFVYCPNPAGLSGASVGRIRGQDRDRLRRPTGSATANSARRRPVWRTRSRPPACEHGDRVAYMLPNIPEMLVANFGVPLAGAVLVAINTRLSAEEVQLRLRPLRRNGAGGRHGVPACAGPVLDSMRTVREVVAVNDLLGPAAHQRCRARRTRPTTTS